MNPETTPPQPDEVATAIADVLDLAVAGPDSWWQAGTEESLEE